jgi:hypothetical protein
MTSSDSSLLGFAKQSGVGVPNVTDGSFKYLLFNQGGMGPENHTLPLDPEVGGGAMLRDVVKVGVLSRGQIAFIPRPDTLGNMLLGATGTVQTDVVLPATALSNALITFGFNAPASPVVLSLVCSAACVQVVTIIGTDSAGGALNEAVTLTGVTPKLTTGVFKTITSIQLGTTPVTTTLTISCSPTTAHKHVFTLGTNQFAAPYYTFRAAPGSMWGEQFQDCRFSALNLAWRGANFVRGEAAMIGGLPAKVASMASWGAPALTDGGPQFLAPVSNVAVPTGASLKVISGSFSAGMNIPMDEQWITGSYSPDAFDITQRAFQLSLVVKIVDNTLYQKAMYDAAGGNAWAVAMMREAAIDINLKSAIEIVSGVPYSLNIRANGLSTASANVVWSAQTIAFRPGKQITMALSGTFLADPMGGEPIALSLVNKTASY